MSKLDKFTAYHAEVHQLIYDWGITLERKYIALVKNLQPPPNAPASNRLLFKDFLHEVVSALYIETDTVEAQQALRTFVQDLREFPKAAAQNSCVCTQFLEKLESTLMREIDKIVKDVRRRVLSAAQDAHEGEVDQDRPEEHQSEEDRSFEFPQARPSQDFFRKTFYKDLPRHLS